MKWGRATLTFINKLTPPPPPQSSRNARTFEMTDCRLPSRIDKNQLAQQETESK
jgi:hypothetical protein